MSDQPLNDERSEWARGWRALFASFIGMGCGWIFANISANLFLKPMQQDFGWSRTELSYGPIAGLIVAGLLPFTAMLIDRYGARPVAIFGLLAMSMAFLFFGLIPADHFFFWTAVVFLGCAGALSNSVVMVAGMASWFERNLGVAIGIMMMGASVSSAIFIPVLSFVINEYDWRFGFLTLSALTFLIGLPVALIWFREPDTSIQPVGMESEVRTPLRQIVSIPAFWFLALGCAFAALPIGGFLSHLVPLFTDRGLDPTVAAGFASVFAVSVAVGRISNGFLLDRLHPPLVVAATLVLAASGALLLRFGEVSTMPWIALGSIVFLAGLAQGAEGDYSKFFAMRLFGRANFPRIVAIMSMIISIFMSLGGLGFAWSHDQTGSYSAALVIGVCLYAMGAFMFLMIRMVQPRF